MLFKSVLTTLLLVAAVPAVMAANLALYWGQNSAGTATSQNRLAAYCQDTTSDVVILSFLNVFFSQGDKPEVNFSNGCNDGTYFPGTKLLQCPTIAQDIVTCQNAGKKVLLSLGGAAGSYGFASDSQGAGFADQLWGLFGNGVSNTRPFGKAVLDGFDLDIEGGSPQGYAAFSKRMRQLFDQDGSKPFYMSASPQCPIPDAYVNDAIKNSKLDFVFVQFYNNYCGMQTWAEGDTNPNFNFGQWDTLVKSSVNPNAKVYLGVPADTNAAGSGYTPIDNVIQAADYLKNKYSSFGGIAMWDASRAYSNVDSSGLNYAQRAKVGLVGGKISSISTSASSTSKTSSETTIKPTSETTDKTTSKTTIMTTSETTSKTTIMTTSETTSKTTSKTTLETLVKNTSNVSSLESTTAVANSHVHSTSVKSTNVISMSTVSVPSTQSIEISKGPVYYNHTTFASDASIASSHSAEYATSPSVTVIPTTSVVYDRSTSLIDTTITTVVTVGNLVTTMVIPTTLTSVSSTPLETVAVSQTISNNNVEIEHVETDRQTSLVTQVNNNGETVTKTLTVTAVTTGTMSTVYNSTESTHYNSTAAINYASNSTTSITQIDPSCPIQGSTCLNEGELSCNGFSYGQCTFGKWVVRACAPGTVCKKLGSGPEALLFCDYAYLTELDTCTGYRTVQSSSNSTVAAKVNLSKRWITAQRQTVPKKTEERNWSIKDQSFDVSIAVNADTVSGLQAFESTSFNVDNTTLSVKFDLQKIDNTNFTGTVVLATQDNSKPIPATWSVALNTTGLIFTNAARGQLIEDGNVNQFVIKSIPFSELNENMAIVIPVTGVYA
ncbi:glycoside hydrolase [Nadsonia fulvescens var. elongata DSM 6958]|uniref:chitinase n=1 Tax=Nadsonia fulvescens var. elongata DSM 6958 TaxID=857566 RepID=A0A1E3PQR5_9ASCO|nr:glycoside hydrolase [Nadsonia fulvescens var. elongata DSM 6958]